MTETEFLQKVKLLFDAITEQIEAKNPDFDVITHGAVLEIENNDGQKVIINQQAALHEVWLASRAGGFHFKWDNDQWLNTRDGVNFWVYLTEAVDAL